MWRQRSHKTKPGINSRPGRCTSTKQVGTGIADPAGSESDLTNAGWAFCMNVKSPVLDQVLRETAGGAEIQDVNHPRNQREITDKWQEIKQFISGIHAIDERTCGLFFYCIYFKLECLIRSNVNNKSESL